MDPVRTSLRTELTTVGWSCEQLIARINELRVGRGQHRLHNKTAYPWLRGQQPAAKTIRDVLAVLAHHTGRRVTAADLGWDDHGPRRRARLLDRPYQSTATELLHETQGDQPMYRRAFFLLPGPVIAAGALDLLRTGAPALPIAHNGGTVSTQLVGTVEQAVRQARDLDDSEGSASVLSWAGGIWQHIGKLITDSRYRDPIGVRLHTAYVEMCETYGWMLFDAGHHPQSQRVYQTGIRLAREAAADPGTHRATVNLLASAAYQESWLGRYHEAATLLDVASHRPHLQSSRVRAVVQMRRIVLAGQMGDTEALRRADGEARRHLTEASDSGDEPWWTDWLGSASIDAQTGRALLAAHHPDLAEPYLASPFAVDSLAYPRDLMLSASELADARAQTGDITGAVTAARSALTLAGRVGSYRVHHHLDDVMTTLRRDYSENRLVRELLAEMPSTH